MKNIRFFLSESFYFLMVKFSVYLNRHVFVMFSRIISRRRKDDNERVCAMKRNHDMNSASSGIRTGTS